MAPIRIWQVDAFADRVFRGNPAAVCLLERWLPDETMQAVAAENALSETAFLVPEGGSFGLRWFTPANEVDLCGHATLAAAWVVLDRLEPGRESVTFQTKSGPLAVVRRGESLEMDLPAWRPHPCVPPVDLVEALGPRLERVHLAHDYLCAFESERDVRTLEPDLAKIARLPNRRGVIATAPADPGRDVHFVSRFFAPAEGVPEDPVTGSAHCMLVPYWAERLGRTCLVAEQVSRRGGRLECRLDGERVRISGRCALFLTGTLELPG